MGSRPPAQVTYRPTPTAATIYRSVIPEKDFKLAQDYVQELKAEREKKKANREAVGLGTTDMMKRQQMYNQQEMDTYKASLPKKPVNSSGSTTPTV